MKKILLTGGNGFFCTRFKIRHDKKYEILSTDLPELDVTDEQDVIKTFRDFNPDYVIHAAAIASTDFCNNHPELAHKVNVQGALNVANACKDVHAKMVFISTEQVFNDNVEPGPYTEEMTPTPKTMYGKNKLDAEEQLKQMLDELWILRFTWLFGFPEKDCGINPNILWNTLLIALQGKKTKVTCHEYRGLTYVHELIDQFTKIFDIPYGTYHIGSHNALSRYDITCHILKNMGLEDRIKDLIEKDTEKYKAKARDVRLCTDKIRRYGLTFCDSKDAIKHCIDTFKFKI